VNYQKIQLKQKEEKISQVIIGKELSQVFGNHSESITSLVTKLDSQTSSAEVKTL
jgi:hypothetical protein